MNTSYFEIWQAKDGWRWRLWANYNIVAESGEAYSTKSNARRALRRLARYPVYT